MIIDSQAISLSDPNYWEWEGYKIAWHVKDEENKIPIILIHGFGANSAHWRHNVNYFAKKGCAVYTIDLLGFGKSDQPGLDQINKLDNGLWSEQLIIFIKEIIRPKNPAKVFLIGNSLGSLVALTCAAYFPDEIAAIIASPLPDIVKPTQTEIKTNLKLFKLKNFFIKIIFKLIPLELILFLIKRIGLIEIGIKSAYFKKHNVDKELINLINKPASRKTAARALRAMCIGMSTRDNKLKASYLLKKLNKKKDIPTLLIWGEFDNFVPLFLGKRIANLYTWVELKVITKSGHCVHDEDPNKFNQISYEWIRSLTFFKK